MFVSLLRFVSAWIVVYAAWSVLGAPGASAQSEPVRSEPAQLLFAPLLLDPADSHAVRSVGVQLRVYHLPDGRRAERYSLGGWVPVGGSHAFAWELAYAGVEADDRLRYGGGAPRWQWTTRLRNADPVRIAVDVAGVLPLGDASLHPVAAKAPSVHARLRLSPVGGARWRVWVGYWGQRIAPPDERDRPLSYFPSGSGTDVAFVGSLARIRWEVWWHQQLGGLLDTTWTEANIDFFAAEDLAVRLGVAANPGPDDRRQFDLGWTLGLIWHPRPLPETP